eukprot:TRINITY_DN1653_c0_g2_i1.p1 TRINITY_DN1653_c0_g2~~TRINITY_DN1653_c0_g2_i1.p1  ORF type:complete len:732 (+),score=256.83 TRINITY_DN1653_c0_g2_i1:145-2340(+)
MRIFVRGGQWRNTEDEILKAAVMKYGLHQWQRVASLLPRKSASQCKRRWQEFVSPSVKKTDWTREEEEKLLHLAKIFPTRWRTIAPLVGRTADQCIQHYEKLLDAAAKETGVELFDEEHDPRKMLAGHVDAYPESKPPRPDPIDMDEDEKEMLAEARARLANTKGKKAKRMAREKQLEEARRLAVLQKRRELRASGIEVVEKRKKRKKYELDYNKEIPFQRVAPKGFYDVGEEKKKEKKAFKPTSTYELDEPWRDGVEEKKRQDDEKKQKKLKEKNLPLYVKRIEELNAPRFDRRRGALDLPKPSFSDKDMEELVKFSAKEGAMAESAGLTPLAMVQSRLKTPGRTPLPGATPSSETGSASVSLRQQAANLIAMHKSQTPLLGDEGPAVDSSFYQGFGSVTPSSSIPNATPASMVSSMVEDERQRLEELEMQKQMQRRRVRDGFSSLPTPVNEYQITLPEEEMETENDGDESLSMGAAAVTKTKKKKKTEEGMAMDAADVEKMEREERRKREERRFRSLPLSVQRGLPSPSYIPHSVDEFLGDLDSTLPERMVIEEMLKVMSASRPQSRQKVEVDPFFKEFSIEEMELARSMIQQEAGDLNRAPLVSVDTSLTVDGMQKEFKRLKETISSKAVALRRQEKKCSSQMSSSVKRFDTITRNMDDLRTRMRTAEIEKDCFKKLQRLERVAIERRLALARSEVEVQKRIERDLQMQYEKLRIAIAGMKETLRSSF